MFVSIKDSFIQLISGELFDFLNRYL